jgi:pilus assembly protein Flp/PilA
LQQAGIAMTTLMRFFHDTTGATAIEYGLLAALFSVAAIVAIKGAEIQLANVLLGAAKRMR